MAITITRTGANTVIAQTGLSDINISASTEVEITYNDAEEFINILLVASTEPPIALEVAEITTVNGVDVTGYTIAQLAAYISANCFGIFDEVEGNFTINGTTRVLTVNGSASYTEIAIFNESLNANYRNWSIANSAFNSGDLNLCVSAAQGGNPISGNYVVNITKEGNVLIGTTTNGGSKLKIVGLPTSSAGLTTGDVWNDGGTLKIV